MAEITWIKLDRGIFDNRKIKQIENLPDGDRVLMVWFKLLTLAGSCNDGGRVYLTPEVPYTPEMLSAEFARPLPVVQLALEVFTRYGMIVEEDGYICVKNWDKYQSTDKMAEIREYNRQKQRESRARRALITSPEPASSAVNDSVNDNVNDKDLDETLTCQPKEKEKEEEIYTHTLKIAGTPACERVEVTEETEKMDGTDGTTPPTFAQVADEMRKYNVNSPEKEAERFSRFNDIKRWNCLPDWQESARLWAVRAKKKPRSPNNPAPKSSSFDVDQFLSAALAHTYSNDPQ